MASSKAIYGVLVCLTTVQLLVYSHKIMHKDKKERERLPEFPNVLESNSNPIDSHSSDNIKNVDWYPPWNNSPVRQKGDSLLPDEQVDRDPSKELPTSVDLEGGADHVESSADHVESSVDYFESSAGQNESSADHINSSANSSMAPTTTKPQCRTCMDIDNAKAFALDVIKKKILQKLGLTSLPNISQNELPKIPHLQKIIDKYNLQSDMPYQPDYRRYGIGYDDYNPEEHARTEKVFALGTSLPEYLSYINSSAACHFAFDVGRDIIKRGKLWVYLRPSKTLQKTVTYLKVFELGPPKKMGSRTTRTMVRNKKILLERAGGWHHFDIVDIVDRWSLEPDSNFGLEIEAFDHNLRNLVVIPPGLGPDAGYEPFLAIRVIQNYRHRSKREAGKECNKEMNLCCRRYLEVDFQAFGWTFVVSPKKFVSNFCSGDCPLIYRQVSPRTHLLKNVNASYESCCKASSTGPLQMLYRKNATSFAVDYIPGMITKTCSCS